MAETNLLNIKEASEYLHVSQNTLRNWERQGKILSLKTAGGHRRYTINELDKVIGKNNTDRRIICPHCGESIIIS